MISQEQAGIQTLRLAACRGFNFIEDEGRRELVKALTGCVDEAHARRAVDVWLEDQADAPTPADIRQMVNQTRPAVASTSRPDPGCVACFGSGFATAWYLATLQGVHRAPRYEFIAALDPHGHYPAEVAALEDSLTRNGVRDQRVTTAAGRCMTCGYGRSLAMAAQAMAHQAPKEQRGRR